jgi:hypothetical protein
MLTTAGLTRSMTLEKLTGAGRAACDCTTFSGVLARTGLSLATVAA